MGAPNVQTNLRHRSDETFADKGSIGAFYEKKVILITGATGFLGKALVGKLLRSCPRLDTIYILIRPKQDRTMEQRFTSLLENSVFDSVKATNPELMKKICPISGDVSEANLGLSAKDKNILTETVNVVFHCAATVKFNEPLKIAVRLNTKGTAHMIDLCKGMKNLISIVHVSTAYSNPNQKDIKEVVYTPKIKPFTMIDLCENTDQDLLDTIEKKILNTHPNTYTFTKNLAEHIVMMNFKELPVAIVRPSVVCSAKEEPWPGWVDGNRGLTGTVIGVTLGVTRTILCNRNMTANLVPVDYVVDTIICTAWHTVAYPTKTIRVYNCTNNSVNISWENLAKRVVKIGIETPLKCVIWYPRVSLSANKFMYRVMTYIVQMYPAILCDIFNSLLGKKPKMFKTVRRFECAVSTARFFTTHEWSFHRGNMNDLSKSVKSLTDGDKFNLDVQNLNWDTYVRDYVLGVKKYVLKEDIENLGADRSRLVMLYWMRQLVQVSSVIVLLMIIWRVVH